MSGERSWRRSGRACRRGLVLAVTALAGVPLFFVSLFCIALLPTGIGVLLAPESLLGVRRLALMAEGLTNAGIAARLFVTEKAVSKHINNVFLKLDLYPAEDGNRRVLAVLTYLNA